MVFPDHNTLIVFRVAANLFTMIGTKFPLLSGCATGSGYAPCCPNTTHLIACTDSLARSCRSCAAACFSLQKVPAFTFILPSPLTCSPGFETKRHESSQERTMSETIRVPRSHRVKDATFWGIIEVNRTKLHIHVQDSEQGRGPGVQLQALPVMHIPGGPALRNGWARRDSEGEIVTRPT